MADATEQRTENRYAFESDGRRKPANSSRKQRNNHFIITLVLLICLLVLLAVVIALAVLLAQSRSKVKPIAEEQTEHNVCLTQECTSAGARINSYIDKNTKPCDDFYQFACGRWMEKHVLPDHAKTYSVINGIEDEVMIAIKNLLETETDTKLNSFKQAQRYYKSCMNETQLNTIGDSDMKKVLEDLGGWPLIKNDWSENNFDLVTILTKLTVYLLNPLFKFGVVPDPSQLNKTVLQISKPNVIEPGRNNQEKLKFKRLIKDIANALQHSDDRDAYDPEAQTIMDFTDNLFNLTKQNGADTSVRTTLERLQMDYSDVIDWKQYVHQALESGGVSSVPEDETIIIESPNFLRELGTLLKVTPKRVLADYLIWSSVSVMSKLAGEKYENFWFKYKQVRFNDTSEQSRYQFCISLATAFRTIAIGKVYVQNNFNEKTGQPALDLARAVLTTLSETINATDWLDENVKATFRKKSANMSVSIGHQVQLMDDKIIDNFYFNIQPNSSLYKMDYGFDEMAFLNNTLQMRVQHFMRQVRELRSPDPRFWYIYQPKAVSTSYRTLENRLMVSVASLQEPLFNKEYPRYLNFGYLGASIGRRLFDDILDQQTRSDYKPSSYRSKIDCFTSQTKEFGSPLLSHPLNQRRYFSDNVGLYLAFKAYKSGQDKQKEVEQVLPGLTYDQNQLFFINFAQLQCAKWQGTLVQSRPIYTSFSVNGALQNFPEFAKAFQCQDNSRMNPRKKCSLW